MARRSKTWGLLGCAKILVLAKANATVSPRVVNEDRMMPAHTSVTYMFVRH
jgi:hypothetical protein